MNNTSLGPSRSFSASSLQILEKRHWSLSNWRNLPCLQDRLRQQEAVELSRHGRVNNGGGRVNQYSHHSDFLRGLLEEEVPVWKPSDEFAAAQKQLQEQMKREQIAGTSLSFQRHLALRGKASPKRKIVKSATRSFGKPVAHPSGGCFKKTVAVEMRSPVPECGIEFYACHFPPEGWRKRIERMTMLPICRYCRPLQLEAPGTWRLCMRLRHLTSNEVDGWTSVCFEIEGAAEYDVVPVVRCCIRTQLHQSLPKTDTHEKLFEQALHSALKDKSLEIQVKSISYSWPQLDVHYAIHPATYAASNDAACNSLHPIEQVLDKLRTIGGSVLGQHWAQYLHIAGLDIKPLSTVFLGGAIRSMAIDKLGGVLTSALAGTTEGFGNLKKRGSSRVEFKLELVVLKALLKDEGRVHTKMRCAHEVGWIEGLVLLSPPLFLLVMSFV